MLCLSLRAFAAPDTAGIAVAIFQDPEFAKHFLGSYGFLSGAEPKVSGSEVDLLRDVLELLKVNPAAAESALEKQTNPEGSAALDFILANLQFQNAKLDAAEKSYRTALEKFPDFRRAHKNLGLLLVQERKCAPALTELTAALALGDRDGRSYGLIGFCYLQKEDNLAAEVAYRNAILLDPDTRDWTLGLARSLMAMEKFKEAAGLFSTLIEKNPLDPEPWLLQANAYLGLEQPMKAAVNLETVRMMGKAKRRSLVLLGDIYMNAGVNEMAKSAYLDAIAADRKKLDFKTAFRAADLLIRTRAYEDAHEIVEAIEKRYGKALAPADELGLLTLKARLEAARGNKKVAAKLLERVVRKDGTRGDALLELADYYSGEGEREKAELLLERAEHLERTRYRALLRHAQLLVHTSHYADASQLLHRALSIKREPRVARFLAQVDRARGAGGFE